MDGARLRTYNKSDQVSSSGQLKPDFPETEAESGANHLFSPLKPRKAGLFCLFLYPAADGHAFWLQSLAPRRMATYGAFNLEIEDTRLFYTPQLNYVHPRMPRHLYLSVVIST